MTPENINALQHQIQKVRVRLLLQLQLLFKYMVSSKVLQKYSYF